MSEHNPPSSFLTALLVQGSIYALLTWAITATCAWMGGPELRESFLPVFIGVFLGAGITRWANAHHKAQGGQYESDQP